MQKIIINGANGFVASNFILELLKRNYEVVALVRNGKKHPAQQRMQHVLKEISENKNMDFSNLKVFDYSLTEEDYSLEKSHIETIFKGTVQFFHFAASLKFSAKDKKKIFGTNVDGLKNSIRFFEKNARAGSRFIFISTAYSCGKFSGVFEEKFYPEEEKSHFRNYYEQSKRVAENVMKESFESGRLNGHVVRLSQVVGNSKTGITKTSYGIFDLAKRLYKISLRHCGEDLRLRVDPDGTQNLIPIEKVVDSLVKIAEVNVLPAIINLTSKTGVKNKTISDCMSRHLALNLFPDKNLKPKNMNTLEKIIARGMSFTGKYSHINLLFDNSNLERILQTEAEDVSKQSLCKMMKYYFSQLEGKYQYQKQE